MYFLIDVNKKKIYILFLVHIKLLIYNKIHLSQPNYEKLIFTSHISVANNLVLYIHTLFKNV